MDTAAIIRNLDLVICADSLSTGGEGSKRRSPIDESLDSKDSK